MPSIFDPTDAIRSAIDVGFSIAGLLGLHPYTFSVVQVTNPGGSRPGVGGVRNKVITPVFNADGYNINIRRISEHDQILSGNTLKDTDMVIGTIVFYYVTPNGFPNQYGFDFNFFDPANNNLPNTNNYQLYFLIAGPDLNPSGNYFEKIYSKADSSLSYKIYVRNLGVTIP